MYEGQQNKEPHFNYQGVSEPNQAPFYSEINPVEKRGSSIQPYEEDGIVGRRIPGYKSVITRRSPERIRDQIRQRLNSSNKGSRNGSRDHGPEIYGAKPLP